MVTGQATRVAAYTTISRIARDEQNSGKTRVNDQAPLVGGAKRGVLPAPQFGFTFCASVIEVVCGGGAKCSRKQSGSRLQASR